MATAQPIDDTPQLSSPAAAGKVNSVPKPWVFAFLLVVVTLAAYFPALRNGFIWDDDMHLTQNPAVTSPGGLPAIWTSFVLPVYYPVTFSAFWLIFQMWGANPAPYHAITLALHIANAALLYFLLRRLRIRAAWLIAAIWALHPVNVESVAWITELKNTLSGLFFFCSILAYLNFDERRNRLAYISSLAL